MSTSTPQPQNLRRAFRVQLLIILFIHLNSGLGFFPVAEIWIAGSAILQPWAFRLAQEGSKLFQSALLPTVLTLVVPLCVVLLLAPDNTPVLAGQLYVTVLAISCVRHAFATKTHDALTGSTLLLCLGFALLVSRGDQLLMPPFAFATVCVLLCFYSLYLAQLRELSWHDLAPGDFGSMRRVLLRMLPVALVVSVVAPEVGERLIPQRGKGLTRMGYSTLLRPGDVARLAHDDTPVALVELGPSGGDTLNYWRGATLSRGFGMEWQAHGKDTMLRRDLPSVEIDALTESHLVTLFKPEQTSLFAPLGTRAKVLVASGPHANKALHFTNGTARLQSIPEKKPFSYSLIPHTAPWQNDAPTEIHSQLGRTHESMEAPLARNLLRSWNLHQGESGAALLDRIKRFYTRKKFVYSTEPKRRSGDDPLIHPLDAFLFQNRSGFCEHFAAATASLLRLGGIPSRVVVGYAYPSWNSFTNTLLIRNSDAHAWMEWWDHETERWIEEDPTHWVQRAPQTPESSPWSGLWGAEVKNHWQALSDTLSVMRHRITQFFARLGFGGQSLLGRALAALGLLGLPFLLIWLCASLLRKGLARFKTKKTPIDDEWLFAHNVLQKIESHSGTAAASHETLAAYQRRLATLPAPHQQHLPAENNPTASVLQLLSQFLYSPLSAREKLQLRKTIAAELQKLKHPKKSATKHDKSR